MGFVGLVFFKGWGVVFLVVIEVWGDKWGLVVSRGIYYVCDVVMIDVLMFVFGFRKLVWKWCYWGGWGMGREIIIFNMFCSVCYGVYYIIFFFGWVMGWEVEDWFLVNFIGWVICILWSFVNLFVWFLMWIGMFYVFCVEYLEWIFLYFRWCVIINMGGVWVV